jgi:hypothetical protein
MAEYQREYRRRNRAKLDEQRALRRYRQMVREGLSPECALAKTPKDYREAARAVPLLGVMCLE